MPEQAPSSEPDTSIEMEAESAQRRERRTQRQELEEWDRKFEQMNLEELQEASLQLHYQVHRSLHQAEYRSTEQSSSLELLVRRSEALRLSRDYLAQRRGLYQLTDRELYDMQDEHMQEVYAAEKECERWDAQRNDNEEVRKGRESSYYRMMKAWNEVGVIGIVLDRRGK